MTDWSFDSEFLLLVTFRRRAGGGISVAGAERI